MTTQAAASGIFSGKHEFEVVFREYYASLCRYASMWMRDADEAEEIVQAVFVRLWEKQQQISIDTSLKSYLYRSVYHESLNTIRKTKVREQYLHMNKQEEEVSHPEDRASVKDLQGRIEEALGQLPEQCGLIFRMSRFQDLKYREIADILNISVKTVENQMGKALKLMRHNLADFLTVLLIIIHFIKH